MANDSVKKALRASTMLLHKYIKWTIAVNVLYCLIRFYFQYASVTSDSFFLWGIFGFITYKMIILMQQNAEKALPITNYQDILIVNWFTQLCSLLSAWFLLLYITVLLYFIFYFMFVLFLTCDWDAYDICRFQHMRCGKTGQLSNKFWHL